MDLFYQFSLVLNETKKSYYSILRVYTGKKINPAYDRENVVTVTALCGVTDNFELLLLFLFFF